MPRIREEQARRRRPSVRQQPGGEQKYEEMSIQELRSWAREMHVEGRSRMSREELIEALRKHSKH